MLEFIVIILGVSLIFYVVFAGADFGAGIYEFLSFFTRNVSRKKMVEKAIGPIWEANHMWLILVVVIFFMGFPVAFAEFSRILHIPIVMILIGITLRGTAFAFRHYDPIDDHWQEKYTWLFSCSSIWTAFWQGVVVSTLFGHLPAGNSGFYPVYIAPWFNAFAFSVGLFVIAVYLFVAQTFFLSEAQEDKDLISSIEKDVWKSLIFVFITGAIVFTTAYLTKPQFISDFFDHPGSITLLVLTTLMLWPLIRSYRFHKFGHARIIVAFQVAFIFLAVFIKRFPILLSFDDGTILTYAEAAAPAATLRQLGLALLVGIMIVLPFLVYLLRVFKASENEAQE
jgi:cytochrome d ubiquinol oxidase subunit II